MRIFLFGIPVFEKYQLPYFSKSPITKIYILLNDKYHFIIYC